VLPRAFRLSLLALAAFFSLATSRSPQVRVLGTTPSRDQTVPGNLVIRIDFEVQRSGQPAAAPDFELRKKGEATPIPLDARTLLPPGDQRGKGHIELTPHQPLSPGTYRLVLRSSADVVWEDGPLEFRVE
jgi:hypothetical protein